MQTERAHLVTAVRRPHPRERKTKPLRVVACPTCMRTHNLRPRITCECGTIIEKEQGPLNKRA